MSAPSTSICTCADCKSCKGRGHFYTDFNMKSGLFTASPRDDTDEMVDCPDCDGLGFSMCDNCAFMENIELDDLSAEEYQDYLDAHP